jgi:hypothetical protein
VIGCKWYQKINESNLINLLYAWSMELTVHSSLLITVNPLAALRVMMFGLCENGNLTREGRVKAVFTVLQFLIFFILIINY